MGRFVIFSRRRVAIIFVQDFEDLNLKTLDIRPILTSKPLVLEEE